jgi:hypothetical protein
MAVTPTDKAREQHVATILSNSFSSERLATVRVLWAGSEARPTTLVRNLKCFVLQVASCGYHCYQCVTRPPYSVSSLWLILCHSDMFSLSLLRPYKMRTRSGQTGQHMPWRTATAPRHPEGKQGGRPMVFVIRQDSAMSNLRRHSRHISNLFI